MILLLGATGYIGSAFTQALNKRGETFTTLARSQVDYTRFQPLYDYLKAQRPTFLINAAGFTGKPNVDACEAAKADTLQGNTLFPQALAQVCAVLDIPWGHISSGCIFSGCQVLTANGWVTEKDMTQPLVRQLAATAPAKLRGFDETMTPNFSFRDGPCSFYSGSKALAEEAIHGVGRNYIWRLRIPFDEVDNPRNYLSKIQRYAKVYDNLNSLSHRADFANACLDMWLQQAPYGIYNITNPGFVSTPEVVAMIKAILKSERDFSYWENDAEFYHKGAVALRSNCIMDTSKLLHAGIVIRPVHEALEDALRTWKREA